MTKALDNTLPRITRTHKWHALAICQGHVKRSPLRWFGHLVWMTTGHAWLGVQPSVNPEPAQVTGFLIKPGNALGSPRRNWGTWLGRKISWIRCLTCCIHSLTSDKWKIMDGWIKENSSTLTGTTKRSQLSSISLSTYPCNVLICSLWTWCGNKIPFI